jgi:hypothetical protein
VSHLRCIEPSVGDSVLDAARSPQALSRDELRHVERCAGCRILVERTRRLAAVYRDLQPSAAEIGQARMRFATRRARRRAPRHRWHVLPRAVTVALLLALVATAAAQIAARHSERRRVERVQAALQAARPAHHHGHRHHRLATGEPDLSPSSAPDGADDAVVALDETAPGERAAADVEQPEPTLSALEPPATPAQAPAPIPSRVAIAKKIAHHGSVAAERPPTPTPTPTPAAALAATPPSSNWEVAATALRAGDHLRAERALDALADASDLRTRDAARLARAQLWISQGRFDRARPDLLDLAATGVTSLIRQRASEALASGH